MFGRYSLPVKRWLFNHSLLERFSYPAAIEQGGQVTLLLKDSAVSPARPQPASKEAKRAVEPRRAAPRASLARGSAAEDDAEPRKSSRLSKRTLEEASEEQQRKSLKTDPPKDKQTFRPSHMQASHKQDKASRQPMAQTEATVPEEVTERCLVSPKGKRHTVTNIKGFAKEHSLNRDRLSAFLKGEPWQGRVEADLDGWKRAGKRADAPAPQGASATPSNSYGNKNLFVKDPRGKIHSVQPSLTAFCEEHALDRKRVAEILKDPEAEYKGWRRAAKGPGLLHRATHVMTHGRAWQAPDSLCPQKASLTR